MDRGGDVEMRDGVYVSHRCSSPISERCAHEQAVVQGCGIEKEPLHRRNHLSTNHCSS